MEQNQSSTLKGNVVGRDLTSIQVLGQGELSLGPRLRFQASPLPDFVNRKELLQCEKLLERLASGAAEGLGNPAPMVVLHGPGGFGKSYLARAIGLSKQVQTLFPDGVLWTHFENGSSRASFAAAIIRALRAWSGQTDLGVVALEDLPLLIAGQVGESRLLWILDGVGDEDVLKVFDRIRHPSVLVATARVSSWCPASAAVLPLGPLGDAESIELLKRVGGPRIPHHAMRSIARRVNGWPLLMSIVAAQIRRWQRHGLDGASAAARVEAQLQVSSGSEGVSDSVADGWYPKVIAQALISSLESIAPEERLAYRKLAVLQRCQAIPLAVLEALWGVNANRAEDLCLLFKERSLLHDLNLGERTCGVHQILLEYLQASGRGESKVFHAELLANARPATGNWWDLPEEALYQWQFLPRHLEQAGQPEVRRGLLSSWEYLQRKLKMLGPQALIEDFASLPEDWKELTLLGGALKRAAHILVEDPSQLASQLAGRLEHGGFAQLKRLGEAARRSAPAALMPLEPSLAPSGALRQTLIGHDASINRILMLRSGVRMVSSSRDRTARLWNLENGEVERTFLGHQDFVNGIAQLDEGRIVTAGEDGFLIVWNLEDGDPLRKIGGLEVGHLGVAVLRDELLVSASRDGVLRLWDGETGKLLRSLYAHSGAVTALVVLPGGEVVSGGADGTIRIWNLESGSLIRSLEGHRDWILDLCGVPENRIASASADGTVRIWDVAQGCLLRTLEGHAAPVSSVACQGPDRVISGSRDCSFKWWDIRQGELLRTIETHHEPVHAVARIDARRVVSGSRDRTLRIWDLEGQPNPSGLDLPAGGKGVLAMASWQGRGWAAAWDDRTVSIWPAADRTMSIWPAAGRGRPIVLKGHPDAVLDLAFLSGSRLLTASTDRMIRLWDLRKKELRIFEGHESEVLAVAALDGQKFVSGSFDHSVRLWDVATSSCRQVFEGHTYGVQAVARLDSQHFVSASRDRTLKVWNVHSREALMTLKAQAGGVMAVARLAGRLIASAFRDGALGIWDLRDGRLIRVLKGHRAAVHKVLVPAPGFLVSAADDRTVRLWDSATGVCLGAFHSDWPVRALALLRRGRLIAGDLSGCIHEFDLPLPGSSNSAPPTRQPGAGDHHV